jgi:hypothetical protein
MRSKLMPGALWLQEEPHCDAAYGRFDGLTGDRPLTICGKIGSLCAAEIISHAGARPELGLGPLVPARRAPSPRL